MLRSIALSLSLSVGAVGLSAQATPPTTSLRVVVVDSGGKPVSAVDVSVLRELNEVLARGTTAADGVRALTLPRAARQLQVVARKIGYSRTDQFVAFADTTTAITVRLVLRPTVRELETVKVTAAEDLKRKSYHIDADEIANSSRPIFDGYDIILKLRPDMMFGRMGPRMASASNPPCILKDVWVNGRRIVYPPISDMDIARRSGARGDSRNLVPVDVGAILRSIKPEHIAELNYADCFDHTVDRPNANNAAFVVLKPGVAFEPGRGSYVDEGKGAVRTAAATDSIPGYRTRVIGVFDEATGDPIAGVEVIDVATGTKAVTTATGTVSLFYLPEGASKIRLHKPDYTDAELDVTIAPEFTLPITTTLSRGR